jgi:4'-phosphopantetheinyl transferase
LIKVIWIDINDIDVLPNINGFESGLPKEYIDRASNYVKEKDRFFYIMGKLLVAHSYWLMYSQEIDWLKIDYPENFGKPKYDGDFYFNISHSGNILACASSRIDLGLDVQQMVSIDGLDLKSALTEDEYSKVQKSENKVQSFWEYWVLKEATLKLTGEGLLGDLQGFKFECLDSKSTVSLKYKGRLIYTYKISFPDNEEFLGYIAIDKRKVFLDTQKVKLNERGVLY